MLYLQIWCLRSTRPHRARRGTLERKQPSKAAPDAAISSRRSAASELAIWAPCLPQNLQKAQASIIKRDRLTSGFSVLDAPTLPHVAKQIVTLHNRLSTSQAKAR